MEPVTIFAIIGGLGIGAQWLAWRLQMPAIVLMLAAGLVAGPMTGLLDPEAAFGELLRPVVAVAVAVILFEGGLTLNLHELRATGPAVRRMVLVGAPLGWLFATLASRYGAGLDWASATVFGGILVVTGPTVIIPLLRQARLKSRPAQVLRWEAIVNDPVGALCAVLAFEVIAALAGAGTLARAAEDFALGVGVAALAGLAVGRAIAWAFRRGQVPEYMKVPVLFGAVLAVYASTDSLLHESGLLAVTVMGVVLANARLESFEELRRFKEHVTVILVSGVFILLAAALDTEQLAQLDWRAVLFILAIVLVARPLAVSIALAGTGLPWQEKLITAWIAPRGIVAVAVAGLFGARLVELGFEDGARLPPLAFALVAATVVLSGFSIRPVARALGLVSTDVPGVLIVGGSPWTVALAERLRGAELPVLVADRNWHRLAAARAAKLPYYHGEILSEAAEHHLDMNAYGTLVAATDNDAYNTLVCTDFAPEFGRSNVFQPGRAEADGNPRGLPVTLGGRPFGGGLTHAELARRGTDGDGFRLSELDKEQADWDAWRAAHPGASPLAVLSGGEIGFLGRTDPPRLRAGDRLLWLAAADAPAPPPGGNDAPDDED
ncbi:cation:proton antiporter [Halovulum marinum]|uniref:cation:proton antiporter n=1 Tax=Halovulum marinum TaxID=2662447 RepID=UPI0012B343C1|nr:sodium:proton antiporter [Halovulum marinum]